MESNLARPYTVESSTPHDSRLVFYSTQSEDLLFDGSVDPVIDCRVGFRNTRLRCALMRNCFTAPFLEWDAEAQPDNRYRIRVPSARLKPGFYDLRVTAEAGNGTSVAGVCTFGFRADLLPGPCARPADFAEFWAKAKCELEGISLDPRLGEVRRFGAEAINAYNVEHAALPADYDPAGHRCEEVEAFKVDFASAGGLRVYGWLAKPLGSGPFPTMLVLPGAGFDARPIPLEHARHGYLALDIQVHGQDVDLTEYPKLPGYYDSFVFDPPEEYYYRKTYLNALQAVNYLLSRPDVDAERLVVAGGSQGGRLSTVVAALDQRVKATIPAIPHFGNMDHNKWAKACNETNADGMDRDFAPELPDSAEGRCLPYYDIMNFAPEIRCPVLMNGGLIDPVSNATGVFSTFNRLGSAQKTMIALPGMGHDWSAEFDRRAWRWLDEVLQLPR